MFGASTVQGFWDSQGGWADRLKRYYDDIQLRDLSKDIPHVMNLGVSGDGSAELLKRIELETQARQNEKGIAVIISIGTNSSAILNGRPLSTKERFANELRQIVQAAKKYTDKIMVVGLPAVEEVKTTPIAWADMHFTNDRIIGYENQAKSAAEQEDVRFVGIHAAMSESNAVLQSHDGLHPNDAGHQLIFELVRPALDELLNT